MKIVDTHYDLGPILYNRYAKGESDVIKNVLLPEWRDNQVQLIVAAVFVSDHFVYDSPLRHALDQIALIKNEIKGLEELMLVLDRASLDKALNENKIGIILSLEGLEPIGSDLNLLDIFYDLGIRAAGLTWSRQNAVADGSRFEGENTDNGLTHFGKKAVKKMRELGMLVDVSHLNDAGLDELSGKLFASHSNAREINKITRNLSTEHLRKIKASSGIIGINGIKPIVGGGIDTLCDHIDYMRDLLGSEHICFGLDKCNDLEVNGLRYGNEEIEEIDVIADYKDLEEVRKILRKRSYTEEEIEGIFYKNFISFLKGCFNENNQ
ncbi:dipeptidase [Acidaminobacter sp. JC074]|uniref:dipeptidase n=1 Tax=Acidaminobacter sp. JC074 TaxID=2530199 RepID=UPI001F0FEFCA|nr:membrane dipeptidase [Acidaminobacter sp. JC074]